MSKLNVGVGADFPVDSAEPSQRGERFDGCDYRHHRRHRFGGRHGWRRGRYMFVGPLALVVFIALISLAVSYPMVILGLVAIAALAFAARHHHHWHDDDDDRFDRGDYDRRDRGFDPRDQGAGPQPDAPSSATQGRS